MCLTSSAANPVVGADFVCRVVISLCFALPITQVAAQSGPAPSYIDSMADYQVKALAGAFAPTNGTSTMQSITPPEWVTDDPSTGKLSGVVIAWSGGGKGIGSKLFVHGGGHHDSANNGVYIFDFAGTSRPTGWVNPLVISPVSAVIERSKTYADGKPTSVHSYDGVVYAKHNNHMYRFMGSWYDSGGGGFTTACFKFNVGTGQWTQLPDFPFGGYGANTFYDPITGKIFVQQWGDFDGAFFRTDNDTWSALKSVNPVLPESSGAFDHTRGRGIATGATGTYLVTLNFTAETVSTSAMTVSGDTALLGSRVSTVYDPVRDVYWLFGGVSGSAGWSTIYELNANGPPWRITAHPLSGDPIPQVIGMISSYGRFTLMDTWRAIGGVGRHDSPAYVIKLPAGTVEIPRAPSGLTTN